MKNKQLVVVCVCNLTCAFGFTFTISIRLKINKEPGDGRRHLQLWREDWNQHTLSSQQLSV